MISKRSEGNVVEGDICTMLRVAKEQSNKLPDQTVVVANNTVGTSKALTHDKCNKTITIIGADNRIPD